MKSRSRGIGSLNYRIALKFDRRRGACEIAERSDNSKHKSRAFETSRDLTIRRIIGSKSKMVYLQSALGHINASGRGKAVLRRSQAVFKCLQWWGIDSFLAEGIPVKHGASKKWIFGSVVTRPGSSNFFIVVVPHEPIGTRSKAVARDGYKTMFDLVGHHQPRLSPPLCQIRPAQLAKHGRRTSRAVPPAFVKNKFPLKRKLASWSMI